MTLLSEDEASSDVTVKSGLSAASLERRSRKRRLREMEQRPVKSPAKRRRTKKTKGRRLSYHADGEAFLQNAQPLTPPASPLPPSGIVAAPVTPQVTYLTLCYLMTLFNLTHLFRWLGPAIDHAYDHLELLHQSKTGVDQESNFRKLHKFRILT